MRNWWKTTLATSCPLVTNSLGKAVKVPTRYAVAVKHLNTLAARLTLHIHTHPVNVCSTNSSASGDVPVPLVSLPQGGGWNGQWRRSSELSGGVTLIAVDPLKNEEQDHSCSEGSNKTCISSKDQGTFDWHVIQSAWVQGLSNFSWHHVWQANTNQLLTKEDYIQQVCPTCLPCPGPANMKHSCVWSKVEGTDAVTTMQNTVH